MAQDRQTGPSVAVVVDTTISESWSELFKAYLLRYMQLLHEKVYDNNVSWCPILLAPESPLFNDPITVGEWKTTKAALPEFAALLDSSAGAESGNHKDVKGKGPAGRHIPLLDGLVVALEALTSHGTSAEAQHILLVTASDAPTLDCLDDSALDGFACSYNTRPQFDGYGYAEVATALRAKSIALSLICTQFVPKIEAFQQKVAANEAVSPGLAQLFPLLSPEHAVMIAGISSILEDKNRKPSGPTNQSQQMPMSSGPPSQSQLSQTLDAAASGIVEVITPSGANKVNTTNLSVQEVQKLKADVDATVTSLAQRLRSNVTQGKMSQDYAKKLYNGIAEKATKQGALLDAVIASKGGPSSNPVTKSSPFVPPQQAQPQPQTKQQQQQPQATMPPVSRSQPQPSVSQPSLQPSNPGQTLVWTGPLVHYSFDPATGQRKDIVTMIEIFPSSRAPLSELTAVAWPQRLEFNKTFPLNGPALQQYVTSFNIPIVNCSPISAATLVSKHIVEDQRRAEMIERVYQQFSTGLSVQKSVAFAQFGPNPNTGIVLMASGVQGRMAGLVFWKTPLPDQMVPGGLSSGSNGRPAQAGQVQQQRQANAPTWGGLQ